MPSLKAPYQKEVRHGIARASKQTELLNKINQMIGTPDYSIHFQDSDVSGLSSVPVLGPGLRHWAWDWAPAKSTLHWFVWIDDYLTYPKSGWEVK